MLSLPKILLLLAVIAVVALLSKSFRGRVGKSDDNEEVEKKNQAMDLSQCAVCGNFVAPDSRGCERADCPLAN